ncbi:hypothetical protein Tco_0200851 [Tanacetum coccineum]
MTVRLADRSFQYHVGIAENMLVEVDLFLHIADVVIQVKQKQLNLGVRIERMIFHIDSAMQYSYSNDDTCFSIDVIDEILEEDFDALLDEGSEILHSIKGTILEEKLFAEFDEFTTMTTDENSESESDTKEPPFEKITFNTDYKIKTSLKEPPTDLELKPLLDNLEYAFLEEPSFLLVIISSQLFDENKNKLVYVLKRHKQAFSWKTTDIPGICIIYPIVDSPWVSLIHCVPKKGGITVVTNEKDELVPIRTVIGWRVSEAGLEVDKAKIDVISKLPPPTNIKGIRSFLGHAGFYQRFIKDFSKIARPLTKLLEKDTSFELDDECHNAFKLLKEKLTCALVIIIMHTDYLALRHLLKKQDAKSCLVCWILLLQEFDIEIKDRKGTENVATNQLSQIENYETSDDSEVDDNFPEETLMEIDTRNEPWFVDFANYMVSDIIPKGMMYQQKKIFFYVLKHYFWKEPYLFKVCSDGMIGRCVSRRET